MTRDLKPEVTRRLRALGLEPSDEDLEALVRALAGLQRELGALAQIDLGPREPAFVFHPPAAPEQGRSP